MSHELLHLRREIEHLPILLYIDIQQQLEAFFERIEGSLSVRECHHMLLEPC